MKQTTIPQYVSRGILDKAALGFGGALLILAVAFPSRVPDWKQSAASLCIAGILYTAVSRVLLPRLSGLAAAVVRTALVLSFTSYLFNALSGFQHVFVRGWMDGMLVSWEHAITGTESTYFLERFVSPALTEWMMFAYIMYIPLLPAVAMACYRSGGQEATMEYLLNFSLTNLLCYAGFVAFPVAGPLCFAPTHYNVALDGGVWASIGEWIRVNMHYPGGCLPSPHCASTTVMIAMLTRYNRRLLVMLLPVLLTIYVATVYGRYHYAWDGIAGILAAVLVVRVSPLLKRLSYRTSASAITDDGLLACNDLRKEVVS